MKLLAKLTLSYALAAGLLATHYTAHAVREVHDFEVTVSIPTQEFYALPADPGFLEREHQMGWDPQHLDLVPIKAFFDVLSSGGAITARLGYEPKLSSTKFEIPLQVKLNNQLLTLTDSVIANDQQARYGLRVPLRIDAVKPAQGYEAGKYYGNVLILFETLAP